MVQLHHCLRPITQRVDVIPRKLQRFLCFLVLVLTLKLFCSRIDPPVYVTVNLSRISQTRPFSSICTYTTSSFPFCPRSDSDPDSELNGRTIGCNVPVLQPFHRAIKGFTTTVPPSNSCKNFPLIFNSTLDSVVPAMDLKGFRNLGIVSCCYKLIFRNEGEKDPDNHFRYSYKCYPISLTNSTPIPDQHEFIAIYCKDKKSRSQIHDMHAFVPKNKPDLKDLRITSPSVDQLNVVILGLDSVSRMNLIRTMPKSYKYLMEDLAAVELQGYNKNGMNTFLCLLPMLTSKPWSEIGKTCGKDKFYDTCPHIWKKFKARGYITSMAEDWSSVAIFHYNKNGFHHPPTDYFYRPLALAAQEEFNRQKKQPIHCQGPKYSYQALFEYIKKTVQRMDDTKKSHFHFTWSTALTHTHLHYAKLMDNDLHQLLRWFQDGGHLKNTVFILMSDHGVHWGDIRKTVQGQLEARLPFLYLVLPPEFKRKYWRAFQNLKGNKRRLTSALDIHFTLRDLANITSRLGNDILFERERRLERATKANKIPKGLSQFLPIPPERTCGDAGIEEFYCSCKEGIKEIPTRTREVKEAALFVVDELNRKIKSHKKCAKLSLRNITLAQFIMTKNGVKNGPLRPAYLINFETTPGRGGFEALVVEYKEKVKGLRWKLSGSVSRASLYGNSSYCVDDTTLKYYCFCKSKR